MDGWMVVGVTSTFDGISTSIRSKGGHISFFSTFSGDNADTPLLTKKEQEDCTIPPTTSSLTNFERALRQE